MAKTVNKSAATGKSVKASAMKASPMTTYKQTVATKATTKVRPK